MAKQIDWTHFDTLLRELGRLRAAVEARTIPEGTVPELRAHIDRAAEAVRRLIDSPDDDELIVSAWELIVVTQTLMARGEQPPPPRHNRRRKSSGSAPSTP